MIEFSHHPIQAESSFSLSKFALNCISNSLIFPDLFLGFLTHYSANPIIETGNHIAQATSKRHEKAQDLAEIIKLAADGNTPWAVFSEQLDMWNPEEMKKLAIEWPPLAAEKISIGDATIKKIAEYYAKNYIVEILTGDAGLKAYEPITSTLGTSKSPQRRRSQS